MKRPFFLMSFVAFTLCPTSADEEDAARIVGGTVVNPTDRYPYQVAMMSGNSQYCGGSLIDTDWVLCAAHCANFGDQVQIGRHDLSDRDETYEIIPIEREIPHPNYNSRTLDNDFMLVKLSRSSTYDPVRLDDGSTNLSAGTDVTVMGWGTTSAGGSQSSLLLEVEVDVVSNSQCENNYGGGITDNMLCASRSGKDSCQGDSGGPLIVKESNAANDVQVGVVSWGNGCADRRFPGVYARISSQIDWINGVIGSTSGGGGGGGGGVGGGGSNFNCRMKAILKKLFT